MSQPTKIDGIDRDLRSDATITLICLFQIFTGCCIFFACLRISPGLTVLGTLIATPAIIRTGLASAIYKTHGIRFGWPRRLWWFAESIGVVLLTVAISAIVFALTSVIFGLFCGAIVSVTGPPDLINDVALIGIFGGMAWGAAAAMVALGLCARFWKPKLNLAGQNSDIAINNDIAI